MGGSRNSSGGAGSIFKLTSKTKQNVPRGGWIQEFFKGVGWGSGYSKGQARGNFQTDKQKKNRGGGGGELSLRLVELLFLYRCAVFKRIVCLIFVSVGLSIIQINHSSNI